MSRSPDPPASSGVRALPAFLSLPGLRAGWNFVWGLAADALVCLYTVLLGLPCIALTLATRKGWPVDVFFKVWSRWIVRTCGMDIEVRGLENVDLSGRYVILSNHLSNLDIPATVAALPMKIRFVAKKELLRVPIFGQALRMSDHIVIDRDNPAEAVETINRRATEQASEGFCVLFYAEGTRSPDGKIGRFKKGGVVFALRTGLPILPLTVSGTRKFLPKDSLRIRPGGKVRLVLDRPIPTEGLGLEQRDELNERVREIIVRNYDETL
ncbi:MAG: 1-acyl-sn-glycerol-3-phosphate acyltransferase [Candidatus Binatia bacterium]|nr:MAG: 1-acyl-sn-glycerol-3-phosphate acyltransferase [Candidatus Binatia bacterium]